MFEQVSKNDPLRQRRDVEGMIINQLALNNCYYKQLKFNLEQCNFLPGKPGNSLFVKLSFNSQKNKR